MVLFKCCKMTDASNLVSGHEMAPPGIPGKKIRKDSVDNKQQDLKKKNLQHPPPTAADTVSHFDIKLHGKSSAIKRASLMIRHDYQDEGNDKDPDIGGVVPKFRVLRASSIEQDRGLSLESSLARPTVSTLKSSILIPNVTDFLRDDRYEYAPNTVSTTVDDSSFRQLSASSQVALKEMKQSWGVTGLSSLNLSVGAPLSRSPLQKAPDAILLSQSWNKVLAFRSMFAEALIGRWRILAAVEEVEGKDKSRHSHSSSSSSPFAFFKNHTVGNFAPSVETLAINMVEGNKDPIGVLFESRTRDLDVLVVGAIDAAIRELCPHNQVIQREAYRPLNGSADPDPSISRVFFHEDECTIFDDFCSLFARYRIQPRHWLAFCRAFLWTMEHQNPYSLEDEKDDLKEAPSESAHARFIAGMVALPMIEATLRRASYFNMKIFEDLRTCCSTGRIESSFDTMGLRMFGKLFQTFPEIGDHFSQTDVQDMSFELFDMFNAVIQDSDGSMSNPQSHLRKLFREQSAKWIELGLSTETYFLIGKGILDEFEPLFSDSEESDHRLRNALAFLWKEAMQFILHPVLFQQNLMSEALKFYDDVAKELDWSPQVLKKRMFEVNMELSLTGQYTHTKEELEIGARLAWRNSAKCIGRIAWNTLVVRDRRYCKQPNEIFHEVGEHLKMATSGTNIQSVMTVFRPQHYSQIWGMRFWSSQFVRYAGYRDSTTKEVLGDPANVEFTSYLIDNNLWSPPVETSAFDVLPVVLKIPGNDVPFLYELPKAITHEVNLEHPTFERVKDLGYKWAAVPAISNFSMTLGGIKYAAAPFNGWFVSIEVARNLLDRYEATMPLAKAMGIDPSDKFVAQKVSTELESAILYSFEKNEFTMVDPMTVGKSFMTHCKREQSAGRECPAQWSWIGGLVGPTNPTWHLEMRDFRKTPQYDYCSDPWRVFAIESSSSKEKSAGNVANGNHLILEGQGSSTISMPKVLIAYGSETGTAEAVASSLARRLKYCRPTLMTLNSASQQQLNQYSDILIICSTFGTGEPPMNAKQFFDIDLEEKVTDTNFAVLALGSSLYPDFCKAGKGIHLKMIDAGAKPAVNLTCVDSAEGQSNDILNWSIMIKKIVLPDSLLLHLQSMGVDDNDSKPVIISYCMKWHKDDDGQDGGLQLQHIGTMSCIQNRELLQYDNESRSTRHIDLLAPPGNAFETGDHISISPTNSTEMVIRLCACFSHELEIAAVKSGYYGLKMKAGRKAFLQESSRNMKCTPSLFWQTQQPFYIESIENGNTSLYPIETFINKSIYEVLHLSLDLSLSSDSFLADLLQMLCVKLEASAVTKPLSKSFLQMAKDTIENYNELGDCTPLENIKMNYPTIVHFFETFGELFCEPLDTKKTPLLTLADVLVMMPRLSPRQYSISSSGWGSPDKLSITVGVLNYRTSAGIKGKGVSSHYLANLKRGETVTANIIQSSFRAPQSHKYHIVLIGAGTGIAPFMGFLTDRASAMKNHASRRGMFGESHLFFGCRSDHEVLYKDQLLEWESSGVISKFHLAQSRQEGVRSQYVQDTLEDYGKQLVELLLSQRQTHVYICGDIVMANACKERCIMLLREYGNMSKLTATRFVSNMQINNRWQLDVWGMTKDDNDVLYGTNLSSSLVKTNQRVLNDDFSPRLSLLV